MSLSLSGRWLLKSLSYVVDAMATATLTGTTQLWPTVNCAKEKGLSIVTKEEIKQGLKEAYEEGWKDGSDSVGDCCGCHEQYPLAEGWKNSETKRQFDD